MELHRGRFLDHLQLVVKDLAASKRFYEAVAKSLDVPWGGEGPGFFYIDELCVSSVDSPASAGKVTGRTHFALQAKDKAGLEAGGKDNGAPGPRPSTATREPGSPAASACAARRAA